MNTHFLIWYYDSFPFVLSNGHIEKKITKFIETMETFKPAIITYTSMLQTYRTLMPRSFRVIFVRSTVFSVTNI